MNRTVPAGPMQRETHKQQLNAVLVEKSFKSRTIVESAFSNAGRAQ